MAEHTCAPLVPAGEPITVVSQFSRSSARYQEGKAVIILGNDEGKKMVERDGLDSFLDEYAAVTGIELTLVAAGERPDFGYEKRGRRYGLEVVRAMRSPVDRRWDRVLGRDDRLNGLDAALLVQEALYKKDDSGQASLI
jgi:hypothetical protein